MELLTAPKLLLVLVPTLLSLMDWMLLLLLLLLIGRRCSLEAGFSLSLSFSLSFALEFLKFEFETITFLFLITGVSEVLSDRIRLAEFVPSYGGLRCVTKSSILSSKSSPQQGLAAQGDAEDEDADVDPLPLLLFPLWWLLLWLSDGMSNALAKSEDEVAEDRGEHELLLLLILILLLLLLLIVVVVFPLSFMVLFVLFLFFLNLNGFKERGTQTLRFVRSFVRLIDSLCENKFKPNSSSILDCWMEELLLLLLLLCMFT
jgi:hypothetical protein